MRVFLVGLDGAVLGRAGFDLQSGAMGWIAKTSGPIGGAALIEGRSYRLRFTSGSGVRVELESIHRASGIAGFLGRDEPPDAIVVPGRATRQVAERRWRRRGE